MSKNKGITLVAMVITIIILLILAGISINSLTDSGLFGKSKQAQEKYTEAEVIEEVKLAYNTVKIDAVTNNLNNNKIAEQLEKELQKKDKNTKVVAIQTILLVSYNEHEITIYSDGKITIEDEAMGKKPTGKVNILTSGENLEKVEIEVIANTTDGDIETIEALNGATLKLSENEGNNKKSIFEVTDNGKYYFRIKGTNGRTDILCSDEITNIVPTIEAVSLLDGIDKINSGGLKRVKVAGITREGEVDNKTYNLNVIKYDGRLILDGNNQVEGATLTDKGNQEFEYAFGNANDVAENDKEAKNMVVLKINGDLIINNKITLTSVASPDGFGGPKGMLIYCTNELTNNGEISMSKRGARCKGENVFLWKNKGENYEYVPSEGATGGASVGKNTQGMAGVDGTNRATGGGGSGASEHSRSIRSRR